jgi:adenine deaminase
LIKGEILTKEGRVPLENGKPEISIGKDIIKLAVMERHHNTNHIGIGFVQGYGLKKGAIASSVSHDSHNLIVIGTNEKDMAVAANCIREMQGGWAIALEGEIIGKLPLPIGGLMSDYDALTVAQIMIGMKTKARDLGVEEGIDPFMTLAFISLPVIPELRLITTGLIDVQKQCTVSLII